VIAVSEAEGGVFAHAIDSEGGRALYLEGPVEKIGLIQAVLESYEGIGLLRTVQSEPPVLAVYTTRSMLREAVSLIHSLALPIGLRFYSENELHTLGILDIDFETLLKEGVQC
jgi:hypothetical protein